jgi:hypothetical protein
MKFYTQKYLHKRTQIIIKRGQYITKNLNQHFINAYNYINKN